MRNSEMLEFNDSTLKKKGIVAFDDNFEVY